MNTTHTPFPRQTLRLLPMLFALFATACASGGLGDILGSGEPADRSITEVRGTVAAIDVRDRILVVDGAADATSRLRNEGTGDRFELAWDERTEVRFEGQVYRPQDLEIGDRIVADVNDRGDLLVAEVIEVTYDTTSGGYGAEPDRPWEDPSATALRGTVREVDTRAATILLETDDRYRSRFRTDPSRGADGDLVTVHFDDRTEVEFGGRLYRPANLERGDEIEVDASRVDGRWLADHIEVVRNVRAGG